MNKELLAYNLQTHALTYTPTYMNTNTSLPAHGGQQSQRLSPHALHTECVDQHRQCAARGLDAICELLVKQLQGGVRGVKDFEHIENRCA